MGIGKYSFMKKLKKRPRFDDRGRANKVLYHLSLKLCGIICKVKGGFSGDMPIQFFTGRFACIKEYIRMLTYEMGLSSSKTQKITRLHWGRVILVPVTGLDLHFLLSQRKKKI